MRVVESFTRDAFDSPKSNHGRSVPMADRLLAQEVERHFQRARWRSAQDLVFAHPLSGYVLDASKVRKRFTHALQAADVRMITFHELRHTFGTQMAAAGAPLRAIQDGWATPTPATPRFTLTTLQTQPAGWPSRNAPSVTPMRTVGLWDTANGPSVVSVRPSWTRTVVAVSGDAIWTPGVIPGVSLIAW